jgi:hypothetical protein
VVQGPQTGVELEAPGSARWHGRRAARADEPAHGAGAGPHDAAAGAGGGWQATGVAGAEQA